MKLSDSVKKNYKIGGGLFGGFVLFTILTMLVDVSNRGVENTKIGFTTINTLGSALFTYNETWYKVSEVFGYLALLVAVGFAALGLYQLVTRKSLLKVDIDLYVLALFYIVVLIFYILFDVVAINYRPVSIEGLEASYPSSHTMLAICVLMSAISQFKTRITNPNYQSIAINVCAVVMVIVVCARLLSGVHWISDIVGGILLSSALVVLYNASVEFVKDNVKF